MSEQFDTLIRKAKQAGIDAMNNCRPKPMLVRNIKTGEQWKFDEGVCGYATIKFAANTAFGRWAKKVGIAREQRPKGGLMIHVNTGGDSLDLNYAYAKAFSAVLRKAGVVVIYNEEHHGSLFRLEVEELWDTQAKSHNSVMRDG
jgi:hypothetical protein